MKAGGLGLPASCFVSVRPLILSYLRMTCITLPLVYVTMGKSATQLRKLFEVFKNSQGIVTPAESCVTLDVEFYFYIVSTP